jgi:predicted nucleic acid-binding protein
MKTGTDIESSKFVIDASVGVKWFSEEDDTLEAQLLLSKAIEGDVLLYAPHLFLHEVANALWKGKHLDKKTIISSLEIIWESPIKFEELSMPLTHTAVGLMTQYDLSFYDATYAALAYLLQIPLISADTKGHKKIKEIEILDLTNYEDA